MVARSGLFVAPVPGSPPSGTAPTDARLALAGIIGTTAQPVSGGAITQSGSAMQFTVAPAVWQLPDVTNAAATFLSPTDQIVLTGTAGPGTGSRVDTIAVKQNNYENADTDSRANVILVPGTPGAPGLPPALAASYYRVADITVPTSAALATACTVVVKQSTSLSAPTVRAATLATLPTATYVGQLVDVYADSTISNNGLYRWSGSAWVSPSAPPHAEWTIALTGMTDGTAFANFAFTADATATVGATFVTITSSALVFASAGIYSVSVIGTSNVLFTGRAALYLSVAGVITASRSSFSGENVLDVTVPNFYTSAGATMNLSIIKTTGGSSNMAGRVRVTKLR